MLSDLLRYVIYKGSAQKVSLTEEAEQLKNLIALNALKDDENININFSTNGLNKHGFIEPMILIPLVENCFKHWDGAYNKNGFIRIEMSSNEKWFCFITENSISKTPKERVEGEGGLGLENIKNRLEMVYGDKVAFNINKESSTFKVKLILEW